MNPDRTHIRTLIASLRLVIEQLKGAHRQLQILCARLAEPVERTDGGGRSGANE
jgi:hypothetical protein